MLATANNKFPITFEGEKCWFGSVFFWGGGGDSGEEGSECKVGVAVSISSSGMSPVVFLNL